MKKLSPLPTPLLALIFLLFLGISPSAAEALTHEEPPIDVPVLLYHCISKPPLYQLDTYLYVTPEHFEAQLSYLRKEGYTPIFAKDLDQPLPAKPVVITFDDGYRDNYTNAFALLKEYDMKATIFLVGAPTERGRDNKLSWSDIRVMRASKLVDVQSHTYNLHAFKKNGDHQAVANPDESLAELKKRIAEDIIHQKNIFQQRLSYTPTVFAYPNGYYSDELDALYRQEGLTTTFTVTAAMAHPSQGLRLLPRIPVHDDDDLAVLLKNYATPPAKTPDLLVPPAEPVPPAENAPVAPEPSAPEIPATDTTMLP